MSTLDSQRKTLSQTRPADWDKLPDIPLYMDQVISYMPRQLMDLEGGETLTSAMVNNYIKAGLLPRADGKKYSREHIALLTVICILKHVLTAREIGLLLKNALKDSSTELLYRSFCKSLDREIVSVLSDMDSDIRENDTAALSLRFSIAAYSRQLASLRILDTLEVEDAPAKQPKQKKLKSNKSEGS